MSSTSLIRPLTMADLATVGALVEQEVAGEVPDVEHVLRHDPGGCWVAEDDGQVVGAVGAVTRELMWLLVMLVVAPRARRNGLGRTLLEVAMAHGRGCLRGMLSVPDDPAGVRLAHRSGFTLHPWMAAAGSVPRGVLPVVERVREGSLGDLDLLDSVDRRVRGSAHGVDHVALASRYRLVVHDRPTGAGYVYVARQGGPALLAATNRRTATELLWESLAASDPTEPVTVPRIGSGNGWALDVTLEARLEVITRGYLGVRQMKPPQPYLPAAHFL